MYTLVRTGGIINYIVTPSGERLYVGDPRFNAVCAALTDKRARIVRRSADAVYNYVHVIIPGKLLG